MGGLGVNLFLLDYECRYIYLSGCAEGHSVEDFLGGRPWDFVEPDQVEESRSHILACMETQQDQRIQMLWKDPDGISPDKFYLATCSWLGQSTVAMCMKSWEFDPELDLFSPTERVILGYLGTGLSPSEIGQELQRSQNTVQTHISRMKQKMALGGLSELVALGSILNQAAVS